MTTTRQALAQILEGLDLIADAVQRLHDEADQPTSNSSRNARYEDRLNAVRRLFPHGVPSGNKIRKALGVNYSTANRLIYDLARERVHDRGN